MTGLLSPVFGFAKYANIAGAPLSFVRSGDVNLSLGYVRHAGNYGVYWSHTAYSSTSFAYGLDFYNGSANPSNNDSYRYLGFSLRCLQE